MAMSSSIFYEKLRLQNFTKQMNGYQYCTGLEGYICNMNLDCNFERAMFVIKMFIFFRQPLQRVSWILILPVTLSDGYFPVSVQEF